MKSQEFFSATLALLVAGQAMAQVNQPAVIPGSGDYGVYSAFDTTMGINDPFYTKAFDNFTLTQDVQINGFCWTGIYAEPFPIDSMANPLTKDTDFVIEIWGVDPANNNHADVGSGALLTFTFEGGATAGVGGADMTVTPLGYQSPSTFTTFGGGEAYAYSAPVDPTMGALAAGDYWISIWADQDFSTPDTFTNKFDPEWQWHLGDGPGDGFTSYDRDLDPAGTPESGILFDGKDLAFEIKVVPEPSSALLALCGWASLGLLRRRRS